MEIQSAGIRSRNIIIQRVKNFKEKEVDKEKRRCRGKEEKNEGVSRFHSPLLESEMFGGRVIFLRCPLRQRRIPRYGINPCRQFCLNMHATTHAQMQVN